MSLYFIYNHSEFGDFFILRDNLSIDTLRDFIHLVAPSTLGVRDIWCHCCHSINSSCWSWWTINIRPLFFKWVRELILFLWEYWCFRMLKRRATLVKYSLICVRSHLLLHWLPTNHGLLYHHWLGLHHRSLHHHLGCLCVYHLWLSHNIGLLLHHWLLIKLLPSHHWLYIRLMLSRRRHHLSWLLWQSTKLVHLLGHWWILSLLNWHSLRWLR